MKWWLICTVSLFLLIIGIGTYIIIDLFYLGNDGQILGNNSLQNDSKDNLNGNKSGKNNLRILYDNTDVTNLFDEKPLDKESIPANKKLKILEITGISWSAEKYRANSAIPATYKGISIGMINDINEISNEDFKRIIPLDLSLFTIRGRITAKKETRIGHYQTCSKNFEYYFCDVEPLVAIHYKQYGEYREGEAPEINMDNSEFVKTLIQNYPNLKNQIATLVLILKNVTGSRGVELAYGTIYYANHLVYHLTAVIDTIQKFHSLPYVETLSSLINENDFVPSISASYPTYDGKECPYIMKGKMNEDLTVNEKLQILGWNEELLTIE